MVCNPQSRKTNTSAEGPRVRDTVDSVGLFPRRLPFTTSNSVVKTFRHALSLDERRAKFKPSHWNRPTEDELTLSESDKQRRALVKKLSKEQGAAAPSKPSQPAKDKPVKKNTDQKQLELRWAVERAKETNVLEVCSWVFHWLSITLNFAKFLGLVCWMSLR